MVGRAGALALVALLLLAPRVPAADSAAVHTQRGIGLSAGGLHREALAEFERALALDPTNPVFRRNLARAHANLGAHLLKSGAPVEAKAAFRAALDAGGEEPTFYAGLGAAALEQRETAEALWALDAALRLAPGQPDILVLMGEAYDQAGDTARAVEFWGEALKQRPEDSRLRERLERAGRAARVEERYEARESHHFRLRAEGAIALAAQDEVLVLLERAFQSVGFALGYYPSDQVPVVLHSDGDFAAVAGQPHWVGGIYSPADGRIRIPARGLRRGTAGLGEVLAHEYTHLVVMRQSRGRAPRWLNEGLATYFERGGGTWDGASRRPVTGFRLPLGALDRALAQKEDYGLATAAYAASASATAFLLERAGVQEVGRLLRRLGEGVPWERALEEAARMDLAAFEREWQEHLR